jgi:hypothetical protein
MPIIINGRSYSGSSVSIINGRVTIDGKPQEEAVSGVVEVRITEGSPVSVQSDATVRCLDVAGDVHAGMEVHCGSVGGNVRAGMGITCGDVSGDVTAGMGVSMGRRR